MRDSGYYWVKHYSFGEWEIGYWWSNYKHWGYIDDESYHEEDPLIVGSRIDYPKDEQE
jgi:hypothetical protein